MAPLLDVDLLPFLLFLAGTGLMILEALAPGAHFIVIGVALFVAGLIGMLFSPLGTAPAMAIMVLAVGLATLWVYREFDFYGGKGSGQTSSSDDLRGNRATVTETVTATDGQVRIVEGGGFNPNYSARTEFGEISEGTEVIVTDPGGGNVLTVAPTDREDEIDRELRRERERRDQEAATDRDSENEDVEPA
ncbi:NfeD family protein [Haloarchaeobius sp. FL176]|uniref:NfeD family protein n=1 Tax=Haloarchaeobius sp. FL176 TaxID=2967129 RepID=UPI0021477587|nr:NfeD family protein [Haloarchaeobius sp. FL176]